MADSFGISRTRNQSVMSSSTRSNEAEVAMYVLTTEADDNNGQFFDGEPLSNGEIQLQKEAFARMESADISPQWIAPEECLSLQLRGRNVFVLPVFRGSVFEHLSELKCKIYGPPIVVQLLEKSKYLPKWSHPVFSETMRGAVVCFTGVDRNERTIKSRCVQWMSGAFTSDLNDRTTHLVALDCDPKSEKYQKAAERGLPVLSPKWVDSAWADAKENKDLSYVADEQVEKFKLKLFDKLVMTVSGLSKEERVDVSRLIEAHGGRFTGEMRSGMCTHLITDTTSGEKYRKARSWSNMRIVTKAWLIDCVEHGYRLNEQRYEPGRKHLPSSSRRADVEPEARSSTPQPDAQSMPDPDFSAIPAFTGDPRMSQMTDATFLGMSSTTAVASPTPIKARTTTRSSSSTIGRASHKRASAAVSTVAALDSFDTTMATMGDCLEGCRILVLGLTGARFDKVKKMINAVGGTRMQKLDGTVTHVIVGDGLLDRTMSAALKDYSGAIVTADWLVESYKSRRLQPPNNFAHPVWNNRSNLPLNGRPSTDDDSMVHETNGLAAPAENGTIDRVNSVDIEPRKNVPIDHMEFTEIDEEALVAAADAMEGVAPDALQSTGTETDDEQQLKIFATHTFRLTNFDEDFAESICQRIVELGGTIVPDSTVTVSMLVCPLIDFEARPMVAADLKCEQIVTIAWLQMCDEMNVVLDPNSNPVFRPVPAVPDSKVLEKCVITITGFVGVERSVFTEIAKVLGASVQETMSRNVKGGLEATTHLVVRSSESEKYKRAVQWKLPVVDAGWLLECVISNSLVPWERYAFQPGAVPLSSFGCRTDDHWRLSTAKNAPLAAASPTHSNVPVDEDNVFSPSPAASLRSRKSVVNRTSIDTGRVPSTSTPKNPRLDSLRSGRKRSAFDASAIAEPLINTPSQFLDPDKPFKPTYNLKKARAFVDELDSPQSTNSSIDFGSVSQVGRVLDQAAKRMGQGINYGNDPSPLTAREPVKNGGIVKTPLAEKPQAVVESRPESTEAASAAVIDQPGKEPKENEEMGKVQRASSDDKTTDENSDERRILTDRLAAVIKNDKRSSILPRTRSDEKDDAMASRQRSRSTSKPPSPLVCRSAATSSSAEQRVTSSKRRLVDAVIGWEDSANKQLRQAGLMRAPDESSQGLDVYVRTCIPPAVASDPPPPPPRSPPQFLFTAVDEKDKPRMAKMVKDLGGVVLDSKEFDASCSHLIAGSTFRNEKLLGSIASGKWVLTGAYLEASKKAGHFVSEADYEWGNAAASCKDERAAKLAVACKRWRIRLAELGGVGAYEGWRCVLFVSSSKLAGMRRLLVSGGGEAWTRDELTSYDGMTHAFVDKCSAWNPAELDPLMVAGVRCFRSDFIASYLMEDPVDERASYWPEYRAAIDLNQK